MDAVHSFFKTPSNETTKRKPGQALLSSAQALPSRLKSQDSSSQGVFSESQPNGSLVQQIAARFVISPPSTNNETYEPRSVGSKGGNSSQQELYRPTCKKTLYSSSTPSAQKPPQMAVKNTTEMSAMFVILFTWLLNQRKLLKDLHSYQTRLQQENKKLQTKQAETQTEVMSLSQTLQALFILVQKQHAENRSNMLFVRKLLLFCALVNLVSIASVLYWSNRAVKRLCTRWFWSMQAFLTCPVRKSLRSCENLFTLGLSGVMTIISDFRQRARLWT